MITIATYVRNSFDGFALYSINFSHKASVIGLTVEIKYHKASLEKNVFKTAFGKLNNIFRTNLIKFYHNCQRMSDSIYHITESSVLN